MRQRSSRDFQRVNSRRLWTAVFFLVALVIFALMSASYFVAGMLTSGGSKGLIQEISQAAECGRNHLLPTAAAIDRYARGTGKYPEQIDDLLPMYLEKQEVLRCPADTTTPKGESSFLYHRPQPGDTDAVLLECPHHNTLLMGVRARGKTEPGKTFWELQMQPLTQAP